MPDIVSNLNRVYNQIIRALQAHADASRSESMTAYMKNKFSFFGITAPTRKEIFKAFKAQLRNLSLEECIDLAIQLYEQDYREGQYFAMEILDLKKSKLSLDHFEQGEYFITQKSWWDTVDYLSTHFFYPILKKLPHNQQMERTKYFRDHESMWMNRVGIIWQLPAKTDTNVSALELAILKHKDSKEFFHQKAIGWALRQYSKFNPVYVAQFLEKHQLAPLSIREASKYL